MDFTRQQDIIQLHKIKKKAISLIGAGAIGSFTALIITKMGVEKLEVYDEDGITEHNIPNQFYPTREVGQFKVEVLDEMVFMFSKVGIKPITKFYTKEKLKETVIVATDSMSSRKLVWEQFKKQSQCLNYIEARMGAELGIVYTILKDRYFKKDIKFYEATLYSDEKAKQLPCTAKSIIYNVAMIASLIGRSYKAIIQQEVIPREQVFNMQHINESSFMIRK